MGELCKNGWTHQDAAWEADLSGLKEQVLNGRSISDENIHRREGDKSVMRPFARLLW